MIDERILSNIPGVKDARTVAVVHPENLSEAEFQRDYVDQDISVLVKGAIRQWPAVQRWTDKRYLKQCHCLQVQAFLCTAPADPGRRLAAGKPGLRMMDNHQ